jgi:hypothetical protein
VCFCESDDLTIDIQFVRTQSEIEDQKLQTMETQFYLSSENKVKKRNSEMIICDVVGAAIKIQQKG